MIENYQQKQKYYKAKGFLLFFLVTFLLFFVLGNKSAQAELTRREAVREYDICEKKTAILEKLFCMSNLRKRLEGSYYNYDNAYEFMRNREEYSEQKLKNIYRQERQFVQHGIAKLSND